MRRVVLTLVGLGMFFGGTSAAMAQGGHGGYGGHHGYRYPVARRAYYAPPRVSVGFAGYPRGCGPAYGVGYGAGYGYGYPQAGFGINTGNFGLWYQQ